MSSPRQADTVSMPSRCLCGHNEARHQVPGFDGECIAESCRCEQFQPRTQHAPNVPPPPQRVEERATTESLLRAAEVCGDRRTELLAKHVRASLDEIRARLAGLSARAIAERMKAEIAVTPDVLPKHRSGVITGESVPCGLPGCPSVLDNQRYRQRHLHEVHGIDEGAFGCRRSECRRRFISPQARAMHERRAHDGFDPRANAAGGSG